MVILSDEATNGVGVKAYEDETQRKLVPFSGGKRDFIPTPMLSPMLLLPPPFLQHINEAIFTRGS